jgi:BirA family biotin operon repressor/biotin-[acetyl-CoA-carboxylase] ligase
MFSPPPADIQHALDAAAPALDDFARLRYCEQIGSTNEAALALALAGEPVGTSVLAGMQHAGRGRRGHVWFSPPGAGLYLSVIVRPLEAPGLTPLVTLAAGVAAADAVRMVAALPVELKWPNDVVIGRPWRKLGGVLCEASGAGPRLEALVVGIGLNLQRVRYPAEIATRTTSIEAELGRSIERAPLVVALLAGLRAMMDACANDRARVCHQWRRLGQAGLTGATVGWRTDRGVHHGRARGIDADGALLVEAETGLERVIAGEVEWETQGA